MMVGRPVLFRLEKPTVEIGEPVLRVEDSDGRGQAERHRPRGPGRRDPRRRRRRGQRPARARRGADRAPHARRRARSSSRARRSTGRTVGDIRNAGVGYIPEDRHEQGLVLNMTLWENAVLGSPGRRGVLGRASASCFIRKIKELAARLVKLFDVRARSVDVTASTLSGGNQQKLILARELETDPKLLIAAQPTRGLDVGAIEFVWKQILEQKAAGRARPADLGRARRDLRAVGPDRDPVRGQDHRRVPTRRPAGADRRRDARRARRRRSA